MQCPICDSENTQRLEVIYDSGTQSIDASSHTVSGVFTRAPLDIANTTTDGVVQTQLAQKLAPPAQKTSTPYVFMVLLSSLCFLGGSLWKIFGALLIIGSLKIIHENHVFNRDRWPVLWETWSHSWFCHKCGHIYEKKLKQSVSSSNFDRE